MSFISVPIILTCIFIMWLCIAGACILNSYLSDGANR